MSGRRFLPALRRAPAEGKALMAPATFGDLGAHGPTPVTISRERAGYGGTGSAAIGGVDRSAGWDMDRVVTEGYEQNIWVFRCVELFAGSQARLPFRVARRRGQIDEEVVDNHPLYRVLNKRANPHETAKVFRKRVSQHVLLSKRGAFIEVTRSRAGLISRLDLLDPARCRPMPSTSGDYLSHYEYATLDGGTRDLPPERVRWIREPHPTDPYSGVTPLEAAGMSVDLDFLARVYNVSFIRNDARPGGVLGIDVDDVSDQELARIQARVGGGAHRAGEIAVLGTGAGGINYVDTTTRPRDMAYGEMSRITKTEILTAFGVGESLLGNASQSTFANAEQEEFNFWTKPMPPHLDLIAGAFEDDLEPDLDGYIDTQSIAALEVGKRAVRAEAKAEFEAGLRSIDEYRPLAGLEIVAVPQTRALWINPSKAPVALNPEDAAALTGGDPVAGGPPEGDPGAPPPGPDGGDPDAPPGGDAAGGPAAGAVSEAQIDPEGGAPAAQDDQQDGDGQAAPGAAAVAEARQRPDTTPNSDAAVAVDAARSLTQAPGAGEGAAAVDAARAMTYQPEPAPTVEAKTVTPLVVPLPGRPAADESVPVFMPAFGDGATEATITRWAVSPGQGVAAGQVLADVASERTLTQVVAPAGGVVGGQVAAVGDTVPVGAPLTSITPTPGGPGGPIVGATPGPGEHETTDTALAAAEVAIAAALAAFMDRQEGVVTTRLGSPKLRKGTAYWRPDATTDTRGGTDPLDVAKAVGAEQWRAEVAGLLSDPVQDAAQTASRALLDTLTGDGHLNLPDGLDTTVLAGRLSAPVAARALGRAVEAVSAWLDALTEAIDRAAAATDDADALIAATRELYAARSPHIVDHLARDLAVSVVNGATDATADAITSGGGQIGRRWVSRGDERVRPSHADADGQRRRVAEAFTVGGESLAYPQDPSGSPAQTRGCRCRVRYAIGPTVLLPTPLNLAG